MARSRPGEATPRRKRSSHGTGEGWVEVRGRPENRLEPSCQVNCIGRRTRWTRQLAAKARQASSVFFGQDVRVGHADAPRGVLADEAEDLLGVRRPAEQGPEGAGVLVVPGVEDQEAALDPA